jgi:hypothetical protein
MVLKDFEGKTLAAWGAINAELMIGSRDWIHANCCIPSTMHQYLNQWLGDAFEVVNADSSLSVAIADPHVWGYDGVKCISGKVWEANFLKMSDFGLKPI